MGLQKNVIIGVIAVLVLILVVIVGMAVTSIDLTGDWLGPAGSGISMKLKNKTMLGYDWYYEEDSIIPLNRSLFSNSSYHAKIPEGAEILDIEINVISKNVINARVTLGMATQEFKLNRVLEK